MENEQLLTNAKEVLEKNHKGGYTVPAGGLYPHQWLWDSCFISIGLRHYDMERAQKEILSLLRGQWSNGMLPHMIFTAGDSHKSDQDIWRSWASPYAPDNVSTSGITQPPMLAEAVVRIGEKLKTTERRTWYQTIYPALVAYHTWLYSERDPHGEGLVLQIHPWETGLDNTPPWIYEMHQHQTPFWVKVVDTLHADFLVNLFRRDRKLSLPGQRLNASDSVALYIMQHRLRRRNYDIDKVLSHSLLAIEDLTFNCIFIRANEHLTKIAKAINKELPKELLSRMKKSEDELEKLWDAYGAQYYSRNYATNKLIKIPSIATLLPLYAGCISKERAEQLVKLLKNTNQFSPKFPVPTVPIHDPYFKPHGYWQGPVWLNTNWLIIDGLKRYGYKDEAALLAKRTLEMVGESGLYEYFSPLDGSPAGAENFSWTAALTIDLLQDQPKAK